MHDKIEAWLNKFNSTCSVCNSPVKHHCSNEGTNFYESPFDEMRKIIGMLLVSNTFYANNDIHSVHFDYRDNGELARDREKRILEIIRSC